MNALALTVYMGSGLAGAIAPIAANAADLGDWFIAANIDLRLTGKSIVKLGD